MQDQNKKQKIVGTKTLIAIIMTVILLVGFAFGYYFYYFTNKEYRTYTEVLKLIKEYGIDIKLNEDGEEMTADEFTETLINALLENDEYKEYYSEEQYQEMLKEWAGISSGLGLVFSKTIANMGDGDLIEDRFVYKVVGNSPAMKGGVKAGDIITDGKVIALNSTGEVEFTPLENRDAIVALIEGANNGDTVAFKLLRGEQTIEAEIVKGEYVESYVTYADGEEKIVFSADTEDNFILEGESMSELSQDTFYIKLDEFNGGAGEQFANAISYAQSKGKTKLILDLRNNGGGKMDIMLDIASYLVYNGGQNNTIIASAKSKSSVSGEQRQEVYATNKNKYDVANLAKIVVLANNGTASASECLINALLYYGDEDLDNNFSRAKNLVISKGVDGVAKTYGKGIMQTTFKLNNGGAIKLTTAKLYDPAGYNCIHQVGFKTNENNSVDDVNALSRAIELMQDVV